MMAREHGMGALRLVAAAALVAGGATLTDAQAKQGGGANALRCYEQALETTTLNTNDAVALCTGARSDGPLDCFREGEESTLLSQENLVALCRCAEDLGPVRCYEDGQRSGTLTNQQLVALCAPSIQGTLYPSCDPAGIPRAEPEEEE